MEAFVEVVDNVPVINLRNGITVSKVALDVVAEGLVRLLDDACQIPSSFGTRCRCLPQSLLRDTLSSRVCRYGSTALELDGARNTKI